MKGILNHALVSETYLASKQIWQDIAQKNTISGEDVVYLYELWQEKSARLQIEADSCSADSRLEKCLILRNLSREFSDKFQILLSEHEVSVAAYCAGLLFHMQNNHNFFLLHLFNAHRMWTQFPPSSADAKAIYQKIAEALK